jgi:7,8-dihydropterin-6-yl-methyl-4-(beta-D-ribofuranosyl)aminobenzene 5'-phosphate synthase
MRQGAGKPRKIFQVSILIEAEERKILLDTGRGTTAIHNASSLGVDLRSVDTIVLSHGHFDHTAGLNTILPMIEGKVPVIAHPDVWNLEYALNKKENTYQFIGIPHRREYLEGLGAEFELSTEPQQITEDTTTSGEEPMSTNFEQLQKTVRIMYARRCVSQGM